METWMSRKPRVAALAASLAAIALGWSTSARALERSGEGAVRKAAAVYEWLERQEVKKLAKALDALAADPAFVEPFRARDRKKLLAAAAPVFAKLKAEQGVTHWYFLDPEPDRTCFLRVHAPALHGDLVARDTFTLAIDTHDVAFGKELGRTAFALRIVKPIRAGGKVVGYMELGEEIDRFLERMKAQTGDDFGLLVDKRRVDRRELARVRGEDRWDERKDVVLIQSTMWTEQNIDLGMPLAELPDAGTPVREWEDGNRRYGGAAFPVRDAANAVVGALFVRHELGPR